MIGLYFREHPLDLGTDPIPKVKDCLRRINNKSTYVCRKELLEALDILDLIAGREVRQHFEVRHKREKRLIEVWNQIVWAKP